MRMTTFVLAAALSCGAIAATAQDTTVADICDDETTSNDDEECVALPVAGDATNFLGFLPFIAGAGIAGAGLIANTGDTIATVSTTD